MKEKLSNLINIKSIVTVILTVVFAYLAIIKVISGQEFLTIFTVVIAFYFGTQFAKNEQIASRNVENERVDRTD